MIKYLPVVTRVICSFETTLTVGIGIALIGFGHIGIFMMLVYNLQIG